ncbi:MAG: nucleotidyl transferase AbiEii/AbiGii toxin family protein [Lachnospiraceae bacterium]|nr:nucleotidyl transferase AbiEii/AbiGii toxin family protein [Lachnospiraceae bacterium]
MIHTSKQLKDKVRNISKGDNNIAKALIRNFIMERFLERVSVSDYRNNIILKGGMLVAAIVGIDMRATMDIDATVKSLPVNADDAQRIASEICAIPLEDGVSFRIASVSDIMMDFEYSGIRMMLEATLERMRQVIKIDISTDDVITPSAVEYEYKLMFEDRTIPLLTYNVETLLAEKIQAILVRGIANTRLRDFYDVYEVMKICVGRVDNSILLQAFRATCKKRETIFSKEEMSEILTMIEEDAGMAGMWEQFRKRNYFVGDLEWKEVLNGALNVVYTCMEDYLWEK